MEKDLNELVRKLKEAAGANLKSVVLYGSAATGDFHPKHSDLNALCVLERVDATELERLNRPAVWWERKGHPAPLVFTLEELRRSADVFAIELLDIQAGRRVLFGEDVFAGLDVPMDLHRMQVERELRAGLIRLRQRALAAGRDRKRMLHLMTASVSTFTALFRHALVALGEQPPQQKRAAVERLAALLGFDAVAFHTVLDLREGKLKEKQVDAAATFRGYLEAVARVADEVDRRLALGK
jgi:predicted nucleotidyltransferase